MHRSIRIAIAVAIVVLPSGFAGQASAQSTSATPGAVGNGGDRTYFEFQVDKPAVPKPDNPRPEYPETLRSAGVEGMVLAQFTVDTTGQPEVTTFKVLKTTHPLFALAVRNALPKMKFDPAELDGRKVKQLVQMPFKYPPK